MIVAVPAPEPWPLTPPPELTLSTVQVQPQVLNVIKEQSIIMTAPLRSSRPANSQGKKKKNVYYINIYYVST